MVARIEVMRSRTGAGARSTTLDRGALVGIAGVLAAPPDLRRVRLDVFLGDAAVRARALDLRDVDAEPLREPTGDRAHLRRAVA